MKVKRKAKAVRVVRPSTGAALLALIGLAFASSSIKENPPRTFVFHPAAHSLNHVEAVTPDEPKVESQVMNPKPIILVRKALKKKAQLKKKSPLSFEKQNKISAQERLLQSLVDQELQASFEIEGALDRVLISSYVPETTVADEPRYTHFVPEYIPNTFADVRKRLEFFKNEKLELAAAPEPKPEPEMTLTENFESPAEEKIERPLVSEKPETTVALKPKVAISGSLFDELAKEEDPVQEQLEEQLEQKKVEAKEIEANHLRAEAEQEQELKNLLLTKQEPDPTPTLPQLASAELPGLQAVINPLVDTQAQKKELPPADTQVTTPEKRSRRSSEKNNEDWVVEDAGHIYGKLSVDAWLEDWFEKNKGHLELHLEPMDKNDSTMQDTRFVDFRYTAAAPQEEFFIDKDELKGKYRLFARIYKSGARKPISNIPYSKPISPAEYKQRIRFHLSHRSFDEGRARANGKGNGRKLLTLSFFEGATGDHRQPNRISEVRVRVLGFPQWGTFYSDKNGNVRIAGVPSQSELLIEASAPNYYSSRKTISVFDSDVYSVAYLISKDKVDAITRYFTKNPQDSKRGIVMGRVFNPKNRLPLAEEKVKLSFRKGKALYVDSLPDPSLSATTKTGLFGFFNVTPSFRWLERESGRPSALMNIRPGFGQYIEFGRAGERELRGRVVDPLQHEPLVAKIKLVGASQDQEIVTNDQGHFEIPGIDLPSGEIVLEVKSSDHYPTTWFSVPWDPNESKNTQSLMLLERDLIEEAIHVSAREKWMAGRGILMGGAEPSLFENTKGCVMVSLLDAEENPVTHAHGPFSWGVSKDTAAPWCLTPEDPRFAFFNLEPGEYILKWKDSRQNEFRTHVYHVGTDRVTVGVN